MVSGEIVKKQKPKIVKFKPNDRLTKQGRNARYKVIEETKTEYIVKKVASCKGKMTLPKKIMEVVE